MSASGPASFFIALAKDDRPGAHLALERATFDTEELEQFARRSQLSGYVFSKLGDLADHPLFTDELLELLGKRYAWQVEVSERTSGELAELIDLLERNDCDVLLLKGLYLATRFYGGIDHRTFWDIDLLIPDSHFPRAQRALKDAGFRRLSTALLGESLSRRFVHGFDYKRSRCKIDLHWALAAHPAVRLDYETLWMQTPRRNVAGLEVRVLPDDLTIATNLLSSFEDLQRSALRLRSFVDLYKILQTLEVTTDWQRFFADREREGLKRISIGMLRLFMEVFEVSEEFPALAAEVARQNDSAGVADPEPADLLSGSALGIGNKRWASNLYEMPSTRLFGWWLMSLPFRLTVYQSEKFLENLKTLGGKVPWRGVAA